MGSVDKCISEQAKCVEYIRENPDGDVRGAKAGLADWMAEEAIERASYESFLESKRLVSRAAGFEPTLPLNSNLTHDEFRFQGDIVRWALRRGRAAIWAGTGMGKTSMELEWSRHVHHKTGKPVLNLCPLAVAEQTASEAVKFGIEGAAVHRDYWKTEVSGKVTTSLTPISIVNYEMLHHFNPQDFGGIVLDESGILKSFEGSTRKAITEFCQSIDYRLSCTATPSPNDWVELGTQCEFLGIMSRTEMLATFFVHDGGQTSEWRLKKHAVEKFWEWVASWAVMITKPSDLGYPDGGFKLPPIEYHSIVVDAQWSSEFLFPVEASTLSERRKARRDSLQQRVDACVELVCKSDEQWVVWCDLNDESAAIAKGIKDAVEVTGSASREHKVQASLDFQSGKARVIVSKPSIYGWGLNWQHCPNVAFVGLSDSFEAMYQAVRRCWRFGQKRKVNVYVITSEFEGAVVRNIKRKEQQDHEMRESMVEHMKDINAANIQSASREVVKYEVARKEASDGWWIACLGDSCEILPTLPSESVGYSIYSPPFASLYTYTNSDRDLGNSRNHSEFFEHYKFIVKEIYRLLKPGRLTSFHCMNLPTSKERDGYIGITDFRGDLIRIHQEAGFIYHSEVCIWKDPVTAMQRTKAFGLLHKQIKKDSCMSRQGIADYLVTMRKPGENPEPVDGEFEQYFGEDGPSDPRSECQLCGGSGVVVSGMPDDLGTEYPCSCQSGNPATRYSIEVWQRYASPVWMDINPSDTLQYRSAREQEDERHICPLQLQVIERGLDLWSNPGDVVLSPFMGIGSEGYVALQNGRRFIGCELKRSYWEQACRNLASVRVQGGLFSE